MSSTELDVDGHTLRVTIFEVVDEETTVAQLITEVAGRCDCPEWAVVKQIDALEDSGLLYRSSDDRDAEVRLP